MGYSNRLLRAAEVADILGIGRATAYELFHAQGFPAIRIKTGRGRGALRIRESALMDWIERMEGKGIGG